MAQVTISGGFGYGFESVTSQATNSAGAKTKVSGMRQVSNSLTLTASEDLGNGIKATAKLGFAAGGRNATPASEDASITLSGGFGALTVGAVEAGNGIVGLGGAGAPVRGLNNPYNTATGSLLAGAGNVDLVQYTSPAISGATFRVQLIDSIGAPGAGGADSSSATASATVIGVRYAAGPLTVDLDSTSGDRNTQTISSTATYTDKRTRLSAGYDFGVARIGYGQEKRTVFTAATTSSEITDTIMGVSVPMGAITLGATYGTSKDGTAAKATGSEFGVKYAFSKRTSLTAQTGSFKKADTSKQSITRIRMDHSF